MGVLGELELDVEIAVVGVGIEDGVHHDKPWRLDSQERRTTRFLVGELNLPDGHIL